MTSAGHRNNSFDHLFIVVNFTVRGVQGGGGYVYANLHKTVIILFLSVLSFYCYFIASLNPAPPPPPLWDLSQNTLIFVD